jgi:hypothetical protein
MRITRIAAALGVLTLLLTGGQLAASATHAARADEDLVSQNLLRDGWDPNESALTPATVSGGSFGQLFATPVDGQVYAQPLVVDTPGTSSAAPGTSVIVGTENDTVYSLNGLTGAQNWSTSLGTPWNSSVVGCSDLTPQIGITSTPVYDPSTGTVYVVAVTTGGDPSTTTPAMTLFALNEQTGAIEWQSNIQGHPANDPSMTFNPGYERQRPGLLMMNGWIYIGFGSVCDDGTYAGYIAGVDAANQGASTTLWTDEAGVTSANPQAGIWMSGDGFVSLPSDPDSFFFATGNGVSPAPGKGGATATPSTLGDSVVKVNVQPDGSLQAADFFSPANAPILDVQDKDFGSGGPIGLPFGTTTYPHLLVQAGKDGRVFLLNADSLGGRGATTDSPLGQSGPYGGQWGRAAAFAGTGGNDYVYYSGTGYGSSDFMRVLQFNGATPSAPTLTEVANTTLPFGYTSGSPVVTSAGTNPASAIVWEVSSADKSGANGTLEAFDAVPANGVLKEIWSAPIGTAAKFSVPATDEGRVYVGSRSDTVYGFGITTGTPPFTGTQQVTLPEAGVKATNSTATVTLTATQAMTVTAPTLTSSASPDPFTMGTVHAGSAVATFPVTMTQGETLTIPVTFTPSEAVGYAGSVEVGTNVPGFTTVNVPLAGTGTNPGLAAFPAKLTFGANGTGGDDVNIGPIPVGAVQQFPTSITNTATTNETVTSVTAPTAPFTMTSLATGTVLKPGQSAVVTVTYRPAKVTSSDAGSVKIGYKSGTATGTVTVPLTGVSEAGKGVLTASASTLPLGSVPLGQNASGKVTFTNTGNLPVTVTRFVRAGVPFSTQAQIPTDLGIAPGDAISLPVTYTPQSPGASTGAYQLTTTDGQHPAATVTITVTGTGTPAAAGTVAVPSPGGGWTLNGSAKMVGTTVDLTQAAQNQAGSAVYYQPVPSNGLQAHFTAITGGGTGGDGATFSLLSPEAPNLVLGGNGQFLGYGGLHGIAVVLGTHKDAGFPSANFVGIATGTASGHLVFAATSSAIPNLRVGAHAIGVSVSGTKVTVTVDGKQYLSATVATMPSTVMPAFTAGTSTIDDVHAINRVSITSSLGAIPAPGGGWSYNGSAVISGSDVHLTNAVAQQAGAVIYPQAVPTASITADFTVQIGGGTGANGETFAILAPATKSTAVGGPGSSLGLAGMSGVGVVFSTHPILGTTSNNFVAIVTSSGSGLTPTVARVPVGLLRAGPHSVQVTLVNGTLTVNVDGGLVVSHKVSVAATGLLAFTGSTGGATDVHIVRAGALTASSS